jgi:hypothetical protein
MVAEFEVHSAPEQGDGASIWPDIPFQLSRLEYGQSRELATHDAVDPD